MIDTTGNTFSLRTDSCQQTGAMHQDCQDVILTKSSGALEIIGLADGQSAKAACAAGGQEVLRRVAEFIEAKGIGELRSYPYPDELTYEVIRLIRGCLREMAEALRTETDQLSSTMVIMAIDRTTGEYVTMHLGDGVILGVHERSIIYISSPENGITSQYTWLTTSKDALNHLRIGFGNIADYSRVVLLSDGAEDLCRGKNIPPRARQLFLSGTRAEIMEHMLRSAHRDDATLIVSDVRRS